MPKRSCSRFDRAEWTSTSASLERLKAAKVFDYPGEKAELIYDEDYEARHDAALAAIERSKPPARIAACKTKSATKRTKRLCVRAARFEHGESGDA